jgi:serine/threonine protein kinase
MRLEGEQLGHYRLTRFIQGGGMGEVYLAEDLTLSRQVAIKVMKTEPTLYPDAQASKDAARLFQREMRAISMLDHAHILTLHEAGEQRVSQENITYMVMPYCPEGSLTDWIRRYHSKQPLSPEEVAQILQQAADALQYAHDQQILHLDVKPANFLVRRQQDPSQLPNLLLADFGVAKIATTSKLSATPRGTFDYMAPEQLAGTPVTASDQYALGIMVYELLTGRTPFQGALPQVAFYQHANVMPEPPSTVNPSLPSVLDGIVLRALAKKPQDRFASVKEFASAFAVALQPNTAQPSRVKRTSRTVSDIKQPSW